MEARRTRRKSRTCLAILPLPAVEFATPASVRAQPIPVLARSPDVTIELGPSNVVASDHGVVSDDQVGIVALEDLVRSPSRRT